MIPLVLLAVKLALPVPPPETEHYGCAIARIVHDPNVVTRGELLHPSKSWSIKVWWKGKALDDGTSLPSRDSRVQALHDCDRWMTNTEKELRRGNQR